MTEHTTFQPHWVPPPGDTIEDILEARRWTKGEFATQIGFTDKHVNQLVNGDVPITEKTALQLERVLGGSASFWLAREAQYRESLARDHS